MITFSNIVRVLVIGFSATIVLLVAAGIVGVESAQLIKESAAGLAGEELVTTRLVNELEKEQQTINAAFYRLSRGPEALDRQRVLAQLDEADQLIGRAVTEAEATSDARVWRDLNKAVAGFSTEARRLLTLKSVPAYSTRDLFRRHEEVTLVAVKLIALGYQHAQAGQQRIEQRSARLVRESLALLGACLLAALACAALTVRATAQLFRKMEWQSSELSRVSWHLLENQETTARRFSHELHDELGQSLMAVKANLHALDSDAAMDKTRLDDCTKLVDEAIRNVRELSHLLRPTILDDFGLDAGLRWLSESFTQRTRIEVEYKSEFSGRLADETETHLFRIVQEALTNVARHSGATKVAIRLCAGGNRVRVLVHDNGTGLKAGGENGSMGMIGMRARARSAGGELTVASKPGDGVQIEVWAPLPVERSVAHGANPAG